ncbi:MULTISPECIES: SAM-dependent methyltransferase [Pseudoalteromonas]|jgi:cyclopropane-fatty-acyl-phospholipid synthase|uniref:Class I SAM-dependent methyltransferase n=2 Tax=Pseudoalteromonas TaxID=53246 RepID=F3BP01_9GAMM|nr:MULTISPECIES: cyclopropane-fatty-acyl-phospholipid synthase family protein [Pseudoalteromonas]EGI71668.1 cyclopropane-fatty-acyl-phospholipid synthase [Pseudoalteromonas distincta]KHM46710.1 cyclopropane-fatty-acyl-phospholipid synthase [Pseudoalteromonas elyakovii]KID39371.1 cyclopropane-fatty-acyl-phospholipid synthase [Pseudoalteromonas distincta]MBA6407923.1 class I SAM-dependent methyltransferase [Pseudoalteromonas sp. 5Ae-yellow]MBE3675358.1 cyclopropane-fatty-acyl-phospholipid syntha|tara:strand:+ start:59892 stop:61154 length:1263 start_codon:yes stop_codon:yes gene_type:complete
MDKVSSLNCEQSTNWLTNIYKKLVTKAFSSIETGQVVLVDANERTVFGDPSSVLKATIIVNDKAMYKAFALSGSVGAGEAYILGHWSCDNLTSFIEIFAINEKQLDEFEKKFAFFSNIAHRFNHIKNKNSESGSKKNIVAHYDLGNDLYESFLSKEMLYSSAVYPTKEATLEEAQQYKLKRICEQVELQKNDSVIEIGTGWGAFAIYAATHYDCHVTTTTISDEQHDYVANKISELGLESKITLLKLDYRQLKGKYDKLVSIEMIEAVGHEYLPSFFTQCGELLKDDGAMLIQAITIGDQRYKHYLKNSDFIQQYIFPGGCLPSLNEMSEQIKNNTDMVIHTVNDIGAHYARTLADWRSRFIKSWPDLDRSKFDERFYRLWLFYFAYCEGAFRARATSTVHLMARKPRFVSDNDDIALGY